MFYFDVLEEFYKNHVEYLIVGGLAVNLHGIPRVTQDIDFILAPEKENILKAVRILSNLNYVPLLPLAPEKLADTEDVISWINEKNMIAFSFHHKTENYKVIDIVISHNLDFEASYSKATIKKINDIEISIASINDIITMKQISGREQDKSDVEMLLKLKRLTDEDGRKGI